MKTFAASCWPLLLALLVLRATPALAHAGLPETSNVTVRRGNTSDMLVGATFGALISRDSGASWRWICPEGMGIGAWRPERYHWLNSGEIIAATGNALVSSKDGGCTWSTHPLFRDTWVTSLAVHPTDERLMYISTGKPYVANSLYRSEDGGATWKELVPLNADTRYSTIRIAPSNPQRLYASGQEADRSSGELVNKMFLMRSDDAGQTWTRLPQPFAELKDAYDLVLMLVSPASADVLWAKVASQGNSYFLKSTDGGATLVPQMDVPDVLIGAESSADGRTTWVATPVNLYRGREGEAFSALSLPNGNACALRVGNVLYGCGSSWVHEWALARSTDEGNTWQPLFGLSGIRGAHVCAEGTPVQQACPTRWPQMAATIGATGSNDAGVTPDPGPPPPPAKEGCSTTAGLAPSGLLLLALTLSRLSRHPSRRA
jgi:photosystem II stability/assembly factor-like uncharacterized protein